MPYLPIEDHGVIGDLHSVALVGIDGTIDWLCLPHFDSPSVFGALLDDRKGGAFRIEARHGDLVHRQFYWPDTNVLVTRFISPDGIAEVVDYMPVGEPGREHGGHRLVRRLHVVRGSMRFRVSCRPAFNYARDPHEVRLSAQGASFRSDTFRLGLASAVPLREDGAGGVIAEFELPEEGTALFLLHPLAPDETECCNELTPGDAGEIFKRTVDFWRDWLGKCTYRGRWREMVNRSALALKLLTYEPTGAIVAAPTTSLPELIGGARNWDYRYTWIRDAAFTLYGFMRIGFTDEAGRFMDWLQARTHELEPDGSLQVMYGIDGRHDLKETTLDHLEGYRGSRPVRIGNGAFGQQQLDIYGELMDSVYLYNKYGSPISYDLWHELVRLLDWVCDHWQEKDYGIWEVRGGPQHFVYSKVMCWVALDRGIRLAQKRSLPGNPRWLEIRDAIYLDILTKGWSAKIGAFTQYYGSETLDASTLMMPLVFLMSPTDPRMLATIDAIHRSPGHGGLVSASHVYRYHAKPEVDGLEGDEGTFNACTFWLVEALTRAGRKDRRRLDQALLLFERMLGAANHLGLYSEEAGPGGEARGNFPQAFTHLALISAAFNLDRALGAHGGTWPGVSGE